MASESMRDLAAKCGQCISRRRFHGLCAGCAAGVTMGATRWAWATEDRSANRPRVRLVFACWALVQDRPTWPHLGYDMRPQIELVKKVLTERCPEVEFLPAVAHSPEDAKKLLAKDADDRIDGYIVYQMNNWVRVFPTIVASGKPTIVADFTFAGSGGFLVYSAALAKKHRNFSVVSSSDLNDLVAAAKCFTILKRGGSTADFVAACDQVRRQNTPQPKAAPQHEDKLEVRPMAKCLEELKKAKIVAVGGGAQHVAQAIQQTLGIEVVRVGFEELQAAASEIPQEEAEQIAQRWKQNARKVDIEQPDKTLWLSARNYLAQKRLMEKYSAEAITINCLGGFYSGKLQAYPCLGYVEQFNNGLIGACEADLQSTATLVVMRHLIGRPGYISDPVIDTSKRQIIYAHCVATTKPFGPDGPENEYEILTHSEDRRGASVRSLLPTGYRVGTLKIMPDRKEIVFHEAVAVENVICDRACRTKLGCEVPGDIEKLFAYWGSYGWHRVTFYGPLGDVVKELAQAINYRLVLEA